MTIANEQSETEASTTEISSDGKGSSSSDSDDNDDDLDGIVPLLESSTIMDANDQIDVVVNDVYQQLGNYDYPTKVINTQIMSCKQFWNEN